MKSENKFENSQETLLTLKDLQTQIANLGKQVLNIDKRLPEELKEALSLKRSLDQLKGKFRDYENFYKDVVSKIGSISSSAATANEYMTSITNAKNSIEAIQHKVDTIKEAIDENPDIIEDIETMNEHIDNIGTLYSQAEKDKSAIHKLYQSLFGYTITDSATGTQKLVKGLKNELDETYETLKTNMSELEKSTRQKYEKNIEYWQGQYEIIKDKVEALLPGAMSAGLAQAYKDKRYTEETEYQKGYTKFLWMIGVLAIVAAIPATIVICLIFTGTTGLVEAIKEAPSLTLALSPVYAALIWLGVFQNKNLKTSKKLIEEYSHKEATAKTFAGLAKQIEAIQDKGISEALRTKLLEQTLEAAAKNPSDCITNHEKSDNPLLSLLNLSEKWIKQAGGAENVSKLLNLAAEAYIKKATEQEGTKTKKCTCDKVEENSDQS